MAEGIVGAAAGRTDFMLVTLGTGVGAGLVLGGQLWRGAHGQAAEFGHVKIEADGLPCGCGASGCVEQYASGTALVREAEAAVREKRLAAPDTGRITPEWLHGRAAAGDSAALAIFDAAGRALGRALSAVVNICDVTAFYIGGGVGAAFDVLEDSLRRAVLADSFALDDKTLELAAARCGNDAGVIGAAHLARQALDVGV